VICIGTGFNSENLSSWLEITANDNNNCNFLFILWILPGLSCRCLLLLMPFFFLQIKSYYGVSRNLLIKFKDDVIDETPTLAQVLGSEAAISSMLDMSIRVLPGDHGLPLQQVPLN
jgi:hypothetical protein